MVIRPWWSSDNTSTTSIVLASEDIPLSTSAINTITSIIIVTSATSHRASRGCQPSSPIGRSIHTSFIRTPSPFPSPRFLQIYVLGTMLPLIACFSTAPTLTILIQITKGTYQGNQPSGKRKIGTTFLILKVRKLDRHPDIVDICFGSELGVSSSFFIATITKSRYFFISYSHYRTR